MQNMIQTMREFINDHKDIYNMDFLLRLQQIMDNIESVYNDIEINRIKSYSALMKMKELEQQLDELLRKAANTKTRSNQ